MKPINVPSYSHLIPREYQIRSIQDLYDYLSRWNAELGGVIPSDATPENQLATKEDVTTSSATYRGSYNLVSDLSLTTAATEEDVAAALAATVITVDNNDYANVQIPSSDFTPTDIVRTDRYKFNGIEWIFEYSTVPNSYTKNEADAKFVASTSVRNLVTLTQAEYDLITTPDANTLYCIIEP